MSTRLVRLGLEVLAGAERLLGGFEAGGTLRFGEVKTGSCLEVVAERTHTCRGQAPLRRSEME